MHTRRFPTIRGYVRQNLIACVALFVALTGTSAYAANTVFSADIVNGEVKTPDLAAAAVADNKLGADAVNSAKVLDNSLKGDDIQESTLALDLPGTAKVLSKRVTLPGRHERRPGARRAGLRRGEDQDLQPKERALELLQRHGEDR